MKYVVRKDYLDFLIRHKDHQIIKVVSGIRRSGKSTLLEIYKDYLLNNNVDDSQIIWINFEDLDYEELQDNHKLYAYIKERLIDNKMTYIFLDEIQHVPSFEKVVDSLFIKNNVDIYITGSNAYFMSGELATLLTGRYVELNILPLSFKEYVEGVKEKQTIHYTNIELYKSYIENSSFPYILQIFNQTKNINEYLRGIYNTILLKDVVARYGISDVMILESVVKYIFDNIGSLLSTKKIADTLTSKGRKIDARTVEKYVHALIESMLIYPAKRYNIKGKNLLATLEKYYVTDIGLRKILLGNNNADQGRILENIVYLELLRRGYQVYVGHLQDAEIDFVAIKNNNIEYYQVSATVLDKQTLDREISAFDNVKDHYPKYLLTFDELGANTSHNGIRQLNVLNWLLESDQ